MAKKVDHSQVVAAYQLHQHARTVARRFGIKVSTVHGILKDRGIAIKNERAIAEWRWLKSNIGRIVPSAIYFKAPNEPKPPAVEAWVAATDTPFIVRMSGAGRQQKRKTFLFFTEFSNNEAAALLLGFNGRDLHTAFWVPRSACKKSARMRADGSDRWGIYQIEVPRSLGALIL